MFWRETAPTTCSTPGITILRVRRPLEESGIRFTLHEAYTNKQLLLAEPINSRFLLTSFQLLVPRAASHPILHWNRRCCIIAMEK